MVVLWERVSQIGCRISLLPDRALGVEQRRRELTFEDVQNGPLTIEIMRLGVKVALPDN